MNKTTHLQALEAESIFIIREVVAKNLSQILANFAHYIRQSF